MNRSTEYEKFLAAVKFWKFFLLLFFCLLPLLQACKENRLQPLGANAVVLAFGDSLTWGTGAKRGEDYPAVLESLLNRQVVNAGRPGETSAEGLERLPRILEEHRPGLVILTHGGNDFLRRLDPSGTRENIAAMVHLVRETGSEVLLVGVPRPGLFLKADPLYEEIASRFDAPCEEDLLGEILSDRSLKSDAIHPNAEGYARMARQISEWIPLAP